MYFSLMGKLNARRNNLLEEDEKGFTLIELLVVVIIIGILAAIAIPVYLGVQNNAKDSAVQSDVVNMKTAAVSLETDNNSLPAGASFGPQGTSAALSTTWSNAGATLSSNTNDLTFTPTTDGSNGFCVEGDSSTGTTFAATQVDGAIKGATCSTDGTIENG